MATTIVRTAWIDDDGTGTTGTIINNAVKTELYNQIDAALAALDAANAAQIGPWQSQPHVAAHFAGTGGMTWTVTAGNLAMSRYIVIGKVLTWQLQINASALSGTPAPQLGLTLPGGLSARNFTVGHAHGFNATQGIFKIEGGPGTTLGVQRDANQNWTSPDGSFYFYATVICEVV